MKFMEKVWDNLGLFEPAQQEEVRERQPEPERKKNKSKFFSANSPANSSGGAINNTASNVVSLPTTGQAQSQANLASLAAKQLKVIVVEPCSFDDAQYVADYLKSKKAVVVNLENADDETTRRMVDFISGTTYALSGTIQKVGNDIFLCAPQNVDVSFSFREEPSGKSLENHFFSWKGF